MEAVFAFLQEYCIFFFAESNLGLYLFIIGVYGIFANRKNIIVILMAIEIMLLAINYNFLMVSIKIDDLGGQIFTLLVLTVAAAESAIGLALLMIYFRARGSIAIDFIRLIKG